MRRSPGVRGSVGCASSTSPSGDAWTWVVAELRRAASPWSSEAFGALYELARAEGAVALRSFRAIDSERRRDLAIDTLFAKWAEIIAAERPRAFFRTVLQRDAISWMRSPRSRIASDEWLAERCGCGSSEARHVDRIDGLRRVAALDARSRAMLVADAMGETRPEIAARAKTSRANVDQVISRARRGVLANAD
jgi:DNA-directed RNA polymerase specialized sigma24 family protein